MSEHPEMAVDADVLLRACGFKQVGSREAVTYTVPADFRPPIPGAFLECKFGLPSEVIFKITLPANSA